MNILIVACARGGSKGIKDKNIRDLAGKPLIAHTIESAKKWGRGRIICSTDSEKIAKVAEEYGAEIPFMRPDEISTDSIGKLAVIKHALKECERIYGEKYDAVIDMDVTAPLRKPEDLENGLEKFKETSCEVVLSVVEGRKNPYFNVLEEKEDGFVGIVKSLGHPVYTRQEVPKVYDMNTNFAIFSKEFLEKDYTMFTESPKTVVSVMDEITAFDIDSERDFRFIEYLLKEKVFEL